MFLVSIYEDGKSLNYQTVDNLNDLYRGLCAGLDVKKFNAMSNFNLFVGLTNLESLEKNFNSVLETTSFKFDVDECHTENLADSVYDYMRDNINMYYDIVKEIDSFRVKITNYKLDK